MSEKGLLVDWAEKPSTLLVEETVDEKTGKKFFRLKGEYAKIGVPTANGRRYSLKLMSREIEKLQPAIGNGELLGELDHPGTARINLERVSHLIDLLEIQKNEKGEQIVYGESKILDTDKGTDAQAIVKAGGKIGISSRGTGDTKKAKDGIEDVQGNFSLKTFDFVGDPAAQINRPDVVFENKEEVGMEDKMTLEDLKKNFPDVVQELLKEHKKEDTDEKKEELKKQLLADKDFKNELLNEVVAGLTDENTKKAKKIFSVLKDTIAPFVDEEVKRLNEEIEKIKGEVGGRSSERDEALALGKKLGYTLFLEQKIGGLSGKNLIRTLVGDVDQFETLDALENRVQELTSAIEEEFGKLETEEEKTEVAEATEEVQKEIQRKATEVERLTEKQGELLKGLNEALDLLETATIMNYAYRATENNPDREKIRTLIEATNIKTQEEVDKIIELEKSTGSSRFKEIRKSIEAKKDDEGKKKHMTEERDTLLGKRLYGTDIARIKELIK